MSIPSPANSESDGWLDQRRLAFDELVWAVEDYAIFTLSPDGLILDWNRGAERLKGYTIHEVVGRHFSIFYPEEDRTSKRPDQELEFARSHGRYSEEGWRVRKDGSMFFALVTITALKDPHGKVAGFLKITRDLSERVSGGEALRQSEESFRLLLESLSEYAIFMLDTGGRVVTWNSGAKRIKGYEPEEIIGQHFSRFYPAHAIEAGTPERLLKLALDTGMAEDEGWRVRKDGTRFWGNVVITSLKDKLGVHRGFAKVTRDLTDRRHSDHLKRSEHRKDIFLATLAHELRNPLAPLLAGSEIIMKDTTASPTTRRVAEMFQRQVSQMSRLIEDLVDISRVTTGKIALRREQGVLQDIIRQAVEAAQPMITSKDQTLTLDLGRADVFLQCDPARITQAVGNLLGNASKYTQAGGSIWLTVENRSPGEVTISLKDNGRGIPPDQLSEIFELFERGGVTSTDGLGIGLALVRTIARLHGGSVEAFSEGEGKGSEFILRLPTVPPTITEEEEFAGVNAKRLRVLIVDDSADSADLLLLFFETEGAEAVAVYDGPSAVKRAETFHPDVACVDLGMPAMNGLEVGMRLKEMNPALYLVAISGWGTDMDRRKTSEAGFDAHFVKPATPEQLRGLLHAAAARA
jgi:PAS domain S-box-containing protein